MLSSFRSQISEETERIENEKLKAQLRKTQAGAVAAAAGISFVVFMLFTLMLVLLAIERDTATTEDSWWKNGLRQGARNRIKTRSLQDQTGCSANRCPVAPS